MTEGDRVQELWRRQQSDAGPGEDASSIERSYYRLIQQAEGRQTEPIPTELAPSRYRIVPAPSELYRSGPQGRAG
jgi:hypothetical protein